MIFAVTCTDRTDATGVRAQTRPAHLEFLTSLGKALVLAGPFLVEAADKAAAEALAAQDPYAKAGLFASVTVQAYRISFLNPPAA